MLPIKQYLSGEGAETDATPRPGRSAVPHWSRPPQQQQQPPSATCVADPPPSRNLALRGLAQNLHVAACHPIAASPRSSEGQRLRAAALAPSKRGPACRRDQQQRWRRRQQPTRSSMCSLEQGFMTALRRWRQRLSPRSSQAAAEQGSQQHLLSQKGVRLPRLLGQVTP
jgi:hypothetical protein